jgi:hypothetical protein
MQLLSQAMALLLTEAYDTERLPRQRPECACDLRPYAKVSIFALVSPEESTSRRAAILLNIGGQFDE